MIKFFTPTTMPVEAFKVMGASEKPNSDGNPIGFFGTGLKYAIATLLREKNSVKITIDGKKHIFDIDKGTFRDVPVEYVGVNGERLAYMTTLGRNWTVEQAYREIASNTKDEQGRIYRKSDSFAYDGNGTLIEVEGTIENVKHSDVFIESMPIYEGFTANIHRGSSGKVYYRGVKVYDQCLSVYSYDIQDELMLTEDRTARYSFQIIRAIRDLIVQCKNKNIIRNVLLATKGNLEYDIKYTDIDTGDLSEEFLEVCGELKHNAKANLSAILLWQGNRPTEERFTLLNLSEYQRSVINEAESIVHNAGITIKAPINYVETCGDGILGLASEGKIFIAEQTIDDGSHIVASTLIEEYMHAELEIEDYTRYYQDYLLRLVIKLTCELKHFRKSHI